MPAVIQADSRSPKETLSTVADAGITSNSPIVKNEIVWAAMARHPCSVDWAKTSVPSRGRRSGASTETMLPTASWDPMAAIISGITSGVQRQLPVYSANARASTVVSSTRAVATARFFPRSICFGVTGRTNR